MPFSADFTTRDAGIDKPPRAKLREPRCLRNEFQVLVEQENELTFGLCQLKYCGIRGDLGMTEYCSGGFDLRMCVESLTDDPRLENQWLVPTNRKRISTDAMVWPMPEEVSKYKRGAPWGYPLGSPNNFSDFLSDLHTHGVVTVDFTPVCFVISEMTVAALCNHGWAYHFAETPRMDELLAWGWQFLGFDVSELNGLCSGLKGCGYEEPSWSLLRARFGTALNDVGLFSDATIASQFAKLRGLEIPSHAPFEVVGILVHDPR